MTQRKWNGIAQSWINGMKMQFIGMGANPNDIIVQDLYTYESPNQTGGSTNRMRGTQLNVLDEYGAGIGEKGRAIISSILSVYKEHITTKRDLLEQSRHHFETSDIIATLVDVMIDDGFNSFQNEDEEFKIEYILDDDDLENLGEEYQQQIQDIIDEFVEKFAIKSKIPEIIPEIIRDGEYAYGVLFDPDSKKGISEIVDDLDVINLLPFYENNKLAFVINQNNLPKDTGSVNGAFLSAWNIENKPVAYKPDNIVFFNLNNTSKKRINMSCFYDTEFRKVFFEQTGIRLPKYVRIATPLYASAMKTLNRLRIMENVSTVLDLNDVLKPEIVHVTVPTNTSPVEAAGIINTYERQLNDLSGFNMDDTFDVSTLAAQSNRRKVLPQWMDTKGSLQSAAINQSAKGQSAWDSVDKLRNLIALNIGIPPFYLNISGTPIDKAQIIKLYSRYTRKLTSLQKCLADGIKDLLMLHFKHMGINVSRKNLSVKFKAITSGDSLDDTDMLVGLVSGISDLYKALDEITASENNNLVLDDAQFKELFDDIMGKYLNVSNLIRVDENKFTNIDGEDGGSGFEPIGGPSGRANEPVSGPSNGPSFEAGGVEDTSYEDFVADTNDIGIEGTEPAIEEI